jgi:hypothetical protein
MWLVARGPGDKKRVVAEFGLGLRRVDLKVGQYIERLRWSNFERGLG